jgi:hypothetical protein
VVVGGEPAAGVAELPLVEERGCERQQAPGDAADQAGKGAAAVALQRELVLEGVEGRLDPLADATQRAVTARLVLAVAA